MIKDKDLKLVQELRHQVMYGSLNWERTDKLLLKAAASIRRLRKQLKAKNAA